MPELTTRLAGLLSDPALRRRMGAASLDIVAEHTMAATLDTFEDIYRQVIAARGGTRIRPVA